METSPPARANSLQDRVAYIYYQHGLFCASHPYALLMATLFVASLCCYPLLQQPFLAGNFQHLTTASNSPANLSWTPRWFHAPPVAYVQQVVVKSAVSPWQRDLFPSDAFRGPLAEVFRIVQLISNHQSSESGLSLSQVCLQVEEAMDRSVRDSLPRYGCLVVSPALLWKQDFNRFQQDGNIVKAILENKENAASSMREIYFGVPWKETGIKKKFVLRSSQRVLTYAITIIFNLHDINFVQSLKHVLEEKYPDGQTLGSQEEEEVVHMYFEDNFTWAEFIPLGVTYVVLFLYIYFSVRKIDLVKYKWALAVSSVVTVVMSLLMSVGLCIWFGLNPTLNGSLSFSESLPYLVVVIGLENMLVLTKSVVSTPAHLDVRLRIAQGLSKEGWSITKNLFTELALLTFAFCTFVPVIQEFCLFAVVGILSDFFLQVVFFATVLSIDIRRMEVYEKGAPKRELSQEDTDDDVQSEVVHGPILQRSRLGLVRMRAPVVPYNNTPYSTSIFAPPASPTSAKVPKRLRLVHFWARTRLVQRGLMICLLLWIIFLACNSGVFVQLAENATTLSLSKQMRPLLAAMVGSNQSQAEEDCLKHRDKGLWRGMPSQHWATLLGYYNISLLRRYISILPPIHLSVPIDPNEARHLRNPAEMDPSLSIYYATHLDDREGEDVPTRLPDSLYGGPSSAQEILLGVALALPAVCFVIYSLVALYRCICPRHYGQWRTSWRAKIKHQPDPDTFLVAESLPVRLTGHMQEVQEIVADEGIICSLDLAGDLCTWDGLSGECITNISRHGSCCYHVAGSGSFSSDSTYGSDGHSCRHLDLVGHRRNLSLEEAVESESFSYEPIWCLTCKGSWVVVGCAQGRLEVWDIFNGSLLSRYERSNIGITCLFLERNRLYAARLDGVVDFLLLEKSDLEEVQIQTIWTHSVRAHTSPILVLTGSSGHLISASQDHLLKVFYCDTATLMYTFHGHLGAVCTIVVDEFNSWAGSGCSRGMICVWDLTTGTCVYRLEGHKGEVLSLQVTPLHLVSLGADDDVCIWEKYQGHLLHSIQQSTLCPSIVLLTPNILVSAREEHLVLWDLTTGEALQLVTLDVSDGQVIRHLKLVGRAVVCSCGNDLYVIHFPAMTDKGD